MKPLLPLTSPLYLKRLVRELNALPDGFYCGPIRYTAARFRNGTIETRRLGSYLDPQDPRNGRAVWIPHAGVPTPTDAYGRTICASRQAGKGVAA